MKAAQKPCIFLENAVCLLVPNETDNGACLTVTRFPQGHIAQKFRDLTKRSLFCVRSSFEPQAHDSLGISALSGSWESRLVCARVVRRDMPACVLRKHDREPVTRQTLSMRYRTPAHLRSRGYVSKHRVLRRAYSYSAGACSCFP